jgi:hypothetical protein
MLRKDRRTEGRTDGSVTISLRNFVGEGITILIQIVKVDYITRTIYLMMEYTIGFLKQKDKE